MSRIPLKNRINGPWTDFETRLFNSIASETPDRFLFSKRLAATQAMLDALDKFVDEEVAYCKGDKQALGIEMEESQ